MRLALLKRQLGLWLLVRTAQAIPLAALFGASAIAHAQPAVVLVTAALGLVEIRLRRERVLLGNLGISWAQVTAIVIAPAAIIEAAIGFAGHF